MAQREWVGGYVSDAGYAVIRKQIAGHRYHFSTGWKWPSEKEGAKAVWRAFQADPAGTAARMAAGATDEPQHVPERESIADAAKEFLTYSEHTLGNGPKHVDQQGHSITLFCRFLSDRGAPATLAAVTTAQVDSFMAWRRQGWATAERREDGSLAAGAPPGREVGEHSVALDVIALKTFAKWCVRTERFAENPLKYDRDRGTGIRIPKRPKGGHRKKVISVETWETKIRPLLLTRWQLVGDILLGSSIRYSSVARLEPGDVFIGETSGQITLRGNRIKNKEGKTVNVSARVAKAAKMVAMMRVPDTVTDFDHALARACIKAKVEHFSAHTFRSTHASLMLAAGMNLKQIQTQLGHESLVTTERYIGTLPDPNKDGWKGPI